MKRRTKPSLTSAGVAGSAQATSGKTLEVIVKEISVEKGSGLVWLGNCTLDTLAVTLKYITYPRCEDCVCREREDLEDHPYQHYHQQGATRKLLRQNADAHRLSSCHHF